jgi:hypothetical protein
MYSTLHRALSVPGRVCVIASIPNCPSTSEAVSLVRALVQECLSPPVGPSTKNERTCLVGLGRLEPVSRLDTAGASLVWVPLDRSGWGMPENTL